MPVASFMDRIPMVRAEGSQLEVSKAVVISTRTSGSAVAGSNAGGGGAIEGSSEGGTGGVGGGGKRQAGVVDILWWKAISSKI